ncbi:molybdopterin-synthase adenylyltransferase MoeB [Silanimonas sp.]|uniref:molybdopterin-synthase adenylyltransferase MoeB n=1 Tax=Silanimonas sp. TaxID=1929290 RepID=UPI0031F2DD9D
MAARPVDPSLLSSSLRRLGAAHRTDAERVPLARARGRVLAEGIPAAALSGTPFPAGHRLRPADLGILAARGLAEVPCARRPTVAVFSSGDALRPPGQALGAGERHDAARPVLLALLQTMGLDPVAWPILPGDPQRAASSIHDAAQAFDLVIACSEAGGEGASRLSALIDGAIAAPFGERAPRSVLLVLPDDPERLEAMWPVTGEALIDAMQGVASAFPPECEVAEVAALVGAGAHFYDVREAEEHALGLPDGARPLPLSTLEGSGAALPVDGAPLVLICARGQRSQRAAALLRGRGVVDVASVRGGFDAWRSAGFPLASGGASAATPAFDADALARYDRHLRLAQVGAAGQQRLMASRVVVVGAGGLGSPAAFYLAAAGVGTLVLVDDDRVERSNLQRQILHTDAAVGLPKVVSARERLLALNPRLRVDGVQARLAPENVEALLRGADVVIDGSDNFATRYLVDAACRELALPLVYGAVERFTGQVSVFDAGRQRGRAPCYRCLFPEPPGADAAPNCAEAGVLGVLPGLIGMLQATEALKLLLGIGDPLVGRLLTVDALGMRFRELALPADPDCPGCGAHAVFDGYAAIETFCASR